MDDHLVELNLEGREAGHALGGKAAGLLRLVQLGMPVPDAWVIPADVFRTHLEERGLAEMALAVATTPTAEDCHRLQRAIMDGPLEKGLDDALEVLPDASYAVRSSATEEDGSSGSYSGIFETVLGVRGSAACGQAVRCVWASTFSLRALTYHRQVSQQPGYPSMAVLIMPLLEARCAGVAFSANPADGNPSQIVVVAGHGLGGRIVDGSEAGERHILDLESLAVVEFRAGTQSHGDFVQADGAIQRREAAGTPVLSDSEVAQIGQAIRTIDDEMDLRVDVEFAFTARGLMLLQARPILGLPPFFPDDPVARGEADACVHCAWTEPLSPYSRAIIGQLEHPAIPTAPWPREVEAVPLAHGRAFNRGVPTPAGIYREHPDDPHVDRSFVTSMEGMADPNAHFHAWYEWTDAAYREIIPPLRCRCEQILRKSEGELATLDEAAYGWLLAEAMDCQQQSGVFYIAASFPTAEAVDMVKKLIQDWAGVGNWRTADALAMDLVQGAPNLTQERDAELQVLAGGVGELDRLVARWGYSYLNRDELIYLSRWRSWREDPRPLQVAIDLLRQAKVHRPMAEHLAEANRRSEDALARLLTTIADGDAAAGKKRSEIFTACVRLARTVFRMKDDRDILMSHAQAALRWVLLEAERRLRRAGVELGDGDILLYEPGELIAFFVAGEVSVKQMQTIAARRRREQKRLARYTLPTEPASEEAVDGDGAIIEAVPGSPGVAEGKAHIVRDTAVLEGMSALQEGDILVLKGEGKVGTTMFLPTIAGLVYENGNVICHEVNLCRELGIPGVVDLQEKVELIREGETLRIDGRRGIVERRDAVQSGGNG